MPTTITENFTPEELFLAQFGKAIAHPARVRMFFQIMNNGTFRNIDFSNANNFSLSNTHNHIYKMKEAKLISLEQTKNEYYVTLNEEVLELALHLLIQPFLQPTTINEIVEKALLSEKQ